MPKINIREYKYKYTNENFRLKPPSNEIISSEWFRHLILMLSLSVCEIYEEAFKRFFINSSRGQIKTLKRINFPLHRFHKHSKTTSELGVEML